MTNENNIEVLKRLTNELNKKDEELEMTIEKLKFVVAQQQVLLNNIPASIFYKDRNSIYISANEAFSKRVNTPLKEIKGKTDYNFTEFKDIADGYYFEDISVVESKKPLYNRQAYRISLDGEIKWEETSKIPYFDSDGNVIGLVGITVDITDKKKYETDLKQSEAKYRTIVESIDEGYYEADLRGTFTFANEAFCNIVGDTCKSVIGSNFKKYITSEWYKPIIKLYHEVYTTGTSKKYMYLNFNKKDDGIREAEISACLIFNEEKKIVGFRGILRDITEQKEIKERSKEQAALLEIINKSLESTIQEYKRSEKKYKFISENMRDIVWELNSSLNFTYFSKSVEDQLGFTVEEAVDRTLEKSMSQDSYNKIIRLFLERMRDLERGEFLEQIILEVELLTKKEEYKWFEVRISPIVRDEKFVGAVGIACNIHDKKIAELEGLKLQNRRSTDKKEIRIKDL